MTSAPSEASRSVQWRSVAYWAATLCVCAELVLGGIWDIARIPGVRSVVVPLGFPTYFLVLLGVWKLLGAGALLIPRRPLLKEWAYAGVFFVYSGAIVSHLVTGYGVNEVAVLSVMLALTVVSWALRPSSRRLVSSSGARIRV
jgi:uncharacterized membrane protein YphA (DoxX/SURF4 family)